MRNRILDWLPRASGSDGAFTLAKRSAVSEAASREAVPEVAAVIQSAIIDRWIGTDKELAIDAGISISSLADMKANGVASATKNFRKLCKSLQLDVRKALSGKKVFLAEQSPGKRRDLHDMLSRLIGTADEPTIERVMRGLLKAAD